MAVVVMLSTLSKSALFGSLSRQSHTLVATDTYARSRYSAPCATIANPVLALDYEQQQARGQEWYRTWIKTRSLQQHLGVRHPSIVAKVQTDDMPSVLGEWGCTAELWAKIRSKRVLLEYARTGEEAKARERLKMLRHSRSVLGISTPMPALVEQAGCDEALWDQVRSKSVLAKLAEAGDEVQLRAKLDEIRGRIAQETAGATSASAPGAATGFKRRGDMKAPVDEAKVQELITKRQEIQRSRDYEKADAIRDELRAMGVDVFDKQNEWRVRWTGSKDGGRERRPSPKAPAEFVPVEMPAQLAEWGCDAALWDAIKSKGSLLKLVEAGNEEYARKRLERMRELVAADAAASQE